MNVTETTYFDHLEMVDMLESNVKKWYIETYPTDECGHYLSDTADFEGVYKTLLNGEDVYDYIGEGDSVIRERVFTKLCDILRCDYDEIYSMWVRA